MLLYYPLFAGIEIIHKPFYASGYRINIDANIIDKNAIETARVYFKDDDNSSYKVFSSMHCKKQLCRATLPSPIDNTKKIYYTIVYSNKLHKVFRSEELVIQKKEMLMLGQNQSKASNHFIIHTEFAKAPSSIRGFEDDVSIVKIKKHNRIGVLVGMLDKKDAGIKSISKDIRSEYGGNNTTVISPVLVGVILLFLIAI
jgi:hypothetical protein